MFIGQLPFDGMNESMYQSHTDKTCESCLHKKTDGGE